MRVNKLLRTLGHTCYVEIRIGRALKNVRREAGEFLPLETFRSCLNKVLSSLIWLEFSCSEQRPGLETSRGAFQCKSSGESLNLLDLEETGTTSPESL